VKELATEPNIPLPEAWLLILLHLGPTGLKEFLAPDEEERWERAVEIKMGEAKESELPPKIAWSLLTQVLAEGPQTPTCAAGFACSKNDSQPHARRRGAPR
jgi:hypothetical protein